MLYVAQSIRSAGVAIGREQGGHGWKRIDKLCYDMAESELAVLTSQCLDRRIHDKQILIHEVAAWEADRNAHHAKVDWQFTTDDARIKLKRLYPTL